MSPCPEGGFHSTEDTNPYETAEDHFDEEDEPKVVSQKVTFLRNTILHTRHFISMVESPQWQLISLQIVATAISLIQIDR